MTENVAIYWQIISNASNKFLSSHDYEIAILKYTKQSINISPGLVKKC